MKVKQKCDKWKQVFEKQAMDDKQLLSINPDEQTYELNNSTQWIEQALKQRKVESDRDKQIDDDHFGQVRQQSRSTRITGFKNQIDRDEIPDVVYEDLADTEMEESQISKNTNSKKVSQ